MIISMPPDHEKSSFHLERPNKPTNKKDVELGTVENNGVLRLVMWGGAFVFGCLLIASTFKKSKKITTSPKRSREGDSDLDVIADDKAQEMEGLRLLLSSSTDIISHLCHTSSKMLTNSIEDSEYENLPITTESILEKKDQEENIVVIIYEEEEYTNSELDSIENATQKYDESSNVAQSFPSTALFDEYDKKRTSSTSSSSSSYSSSSLSSTLSEETSSTGVLSQEIEEDDKNIDIIIYIDHDDENYESEHDHIYIV
ncbi:hypothetical protein IC575_002506 [Cucumis melo]|uniref:Uncharacterized protein LOC103492795 n=2 Tax=Cucumis melo TaxID=3656 RepID=A0A1S3BRP4_CUCME|nr:uncharacterized protein LOC103492795 [Cucumis melo]